MENWKFALKKIRKKTFFEKILNFFFSKSFFWWDFFLHHLLFISFRMHPVPAPNFKFNIPKKSRVKIVNGFFANEDLTAVTLDLTMIYVRMVLLWRKAKVYDKCGKIWNATEYDNWFWYELGSFMFLTTWFLWCLNDKAKFW